ncbi:MAG: putative RHS-repeat protein [Gammaproteobacteria bacterium]|jgi:hypothetical protein|nr:putative RHS-repeat protein [Gammaproteobacteria bacterium]
MRPRSRRFVVPQAVNDALERVFGEPVDTVVVIEHSLYARAHLNMSATTRPNRILLSISGARFIATHELLLHEYFHVVRQWRPGHLTRWRYLIESARCGYWNNRYEREAREFAATAADRYRLYLHGPPQ